MFGLPQGAAPEEIVGEFTSDPATRIKNVYMDADGSYLVDGQIVVRQVVVLTPGFKLLGRLGGRHRGHGVGESLRSGVAHALHEL